MTPKLSPEDWARLSALFDQALEQPEAAREAWLAALPLQHAPLAALLRELLAAHANRPAVARLERGPRFGPPGAGDPAGLAPGRHVGPWRLVALLGSGGMATVWRAERADGAYRREVALKLPLQRLTDRVSALRFQRECDILARLEHPHIARLYDASLVDLAADPAEAQATAGAGPLPWLAMELVAGQPLDKWCREQRAPLAQRLRLFVQVLQAVQHAHSHLVLHRDLKASNILVTPQGQVKLLDFGIATLTQDTEAAGGLGWPGPRVMTAAFAAPEQVDNGPLSTATDLYAAGVVLFDLLTGARPYRGATQTPAELERAILHGELRAASQACTAEAAAAMGLSLPALRRALAGDIDAILARALQREPAQRYESAQAFAADLLHHLGHWPVQARASTPGYVFGRFLARRRGAVMAGSVAVLCVAAGLALAAWQAQLARQQVARAQAAQAANQAGQAFIADLLNDALRAGRPLQADELLARAERMARQSLAGRPDALAAVLWLVAQRAGDWDGQDRSRLLLTEALALAQDPDLRDHIGCDDAYAQSQLGDVAAATRRLQAIASQDGALPSARACALGHLAFLAGQGGRLPEAVALQQASLQQLDFVPDMPEHLRAAAMARLALFKSQQGLGPESDRLFARALAVLSAGGRERSQTAWGVRNDWAIALSSAGDARQALALGRQNLRFMDDGGPYSTKMLYTARGVGVTALAAGLLDEAAAVFDEALARARAAGAVTPEILRAIECDRALLATRAHRLDEAVKALARADQVPRRASATDAFYDRGCRLARAEFDIARGAAAPALAAVQTVIAEADAQAPPWQWTARLLAARAHLALGDTGQAQAEARRALALAQQLQAQRPHSVRTGSALQWLGAAQAAAGDAAAAQGSLQQAVQQLEGSVAAGHPGLAEVRVGLAALAAAPVAAEAASSGGR